MQNQGITCTLIGRGFVEVGMGLSRGITVKPDLSCIDQMHRVFWPGSCDGKL